MPISPTLRCRFAYDAIRRCLFRRHVAADLPRCRHYYYLRRDAAFSACHATPPPLFSPPLRFSMVASFRRHAIAAATPPLVAAAAARHFCLLTASCRLRMPCRQRDARHAARLALRALPPPPLLICRRHAVIRCHAMPRAAVFALRRYADAAATSARRRRQHFSLPLLADVVIFDAAITPLSTPRFFAATPAAALYAFAAAFERYCCASDGRWINAPACRFIALSFAAATLPCHAPRRHDACRRERPRHAFAFSCRATYAALIYAAASRRQRLFAER